MEKVFIVYNIIHITFLYKATYKLLHTNSNRNIAMDYYNH